MASSDEGAHTWAPKTGSAEAWAACRKFGTAVEGSAQKMLH